jgi:hypothetical protein
MRQNLVLNNVDIIAKKTSQLWAQTVYLNHRNRQKTLKPRNSILQLCNSAPTSPQVRVSITTITTATTTQATIAAAAASPSPETTEAAVEAEEAAVIVSAAVVEAEEEEEEETTALWMTVRRITEEAVCSIRNNASIEVESMVEVDLGVNTMIVLSDARSSVFFSGGISSFGGILLRSPWALMGLRTRELRGHGVGGVSHSISGECIDYLYCSRRVRLPT